MITKQQMEIKAGDVVWAKIPRSEDKESQLQSGVRPILILGNAKAAKYSPTLQYIPITSKIKRTDLPIHVVIGDLMKPSMTLAEQIHTIDRHNILDKITTLTDETMRWIKASLIIQIGINPEEIKPYFYKLSNKIQKAV